MVLSQGGGYPESCGQDLSAITELVKTAEDNLAHTEERMRGAMQILAAAVPNARSKMSEHEYVECIALLESAKASLFGATTDLREELQAEIDEIYVQAEIGVRFTALERRADEIEAEVKSMVDRGMFDMAREVPFFPAIYICVCVCIHSYACTCVSAWLSRVI
jgi:hypothetical protein